VTSIGHIACALPEHALTNAELARENPSWDMDRVAKQVGILSRHVAAQDETAFDLSVRACEALIEESDLDLESIDAIVYCTQNPDYHMSGNAHLLHRHFGMGPHVLAFDYTLACSGYVYGLAFADAFICRGLASQVLLVTADTLAKRANPQDRAVRVLFGDGAAVTHISDDNRGGNIVASKLCSSGGDMDRIYIRAGGARMPSSEETRRNKTDRNGNVRSLEDIKMDGPGVWAFINSIVPGHIREFLVEQSLTLDSIDLYVFHQASKLTLDSLARALRIPPDKLYRHLMHVGNLSSASIPFALRAALDEKAVKSGDRLLLSGFGAGASYGSVLVEY
jgi:3-oxoacyl-[acyl-carrier-protein] synthase III